MRAFHAFLTALLLLLGALSTPAHAAADCAGWGAGWKLDGLYGAYTRRSVTQFQRARHLQVDGVAGPRTLEALRRPYHGTLRCGSSGAEVRALQQALAARGYWRDGRAHAAARVAMARQARIAALRPRPITPRPPHVVATRPPQVLVTGPRPGKVSTRPRPVPVVPITIAPKPRPSTGGWQEPVPFVPDPAGHRPLPAVPHPLIRPAAEVVPIEVVTPPPAFTIIAVPTAPPTPPAVRPPAPLPTPDLMRDPEAPPIKAAPVTGPEASPVVEAHGGAWLAARGASFSTAVPVLSGDATLWLGDWGLQVAATNLDAPTTTAQLFDLAAACRLGPGQVSVGYQGIGAGQAHMAAVGASIEQPLGVSWLEGHAGVRAATNLNDFTAGAHAGLGVKAGPAALEAGVRGLVLRAAGANIPDPIDFEGPYVQLRIRL